MLKTNASSAEPADPAAQSCLSLNRRELLAAAGALLAVPAFGLRVAKARESGGPLNAWVTLDEQGAVTILCPVGDMGQGILHSLPLMLADEMEVAWDDVQVRYAPLDPAAYGNAARLDRGQGSGNSVSVMGYHKGLRQAGAADPRDAGGGCRGRMGCAGLGVLRRAIARLEQWPLAELRGTGRKAAAMPVPEAPRLKSREEFRLIGKHAPRKDSASKVMGTFPFMADSAGGDPALHAAVLNAPRRGARLKSLAYESPDGAWPKGHGHRRSGGGGGGRRLLDGVLGAGAGRHRLGGAATPAARNRSSKNCAVRSRARKAATGLKHGDPESVLASAERTLDATYEAPILAHANMEPLGATARFSGDGCELWVPSQNLQRLQAGHRQYLRPGAGTGAAAPTATWAAHLDGASSRRWPCKPCRSQKELHEQGTAGPAGSAGVEPRAGHAPRLLPAALRGAAACGAGRVRTPERMDGQVGRAFAAGRALAVDGGRIGGSVVGGRSLQRPVRSSRPARELCDAANAGARRILAQRGRQHELVLRREFPRRGGACGWPQSGGTARRTHHRSARAQSAGDGGRRLDRAKRHSGGQAVLQLHRHSGGTGNQGRGRGGREGSAPPWTADWRWIRTTSRRRSRAPSCMA